MHARSLSLLSLALSTACLTAWGCAPGDDASRPGPDPHTPAPGSATIATPLAAPSPTVAPVQDPASVRATIHSVNLSMWVDDPARALEQAEKLLRKLGGEVTYASSSGGNANLNGRVPIDARHRLRDALAQLGGHVESENLSTSDVSHDVRRLQRRLATLQRADAQVAASFAGQADPTQIEAAALLRELTDRERQSIEAQLESYRVQTADAQVNVSFNRRAP